MSLKEAEAGYHQAPARFSDPRSSSLLSSLGSSGKLGGKLNAFSMNSDADGGGGFGADNNDHGGRDANQDGAHDLPQRYFTLKFKNIYFDIDILIMNIIL